MRIARVRLHLFRGYVDQVIMPSRHAVVVGEPRAGRSDLITGLRRALDPRSWSRTPDLSDLHRPTPEQEEGAQDGRRSRLHQKLTASLVMAHRIISVRYRTWCYRSNSGHRVKSNQ